MKPNKFVISMALKLLGKHAELKFSTWQNWIVISESSSSKLHIRPEDFYGLEKQGLIVVEKTTFGKGKVRLA